MSPAYKVSNHPFVRPVANMLGVPRIVNSVFTDEP